MTADREVPMPPGRFDPTTGRGPTVVTPDRCPVGHRHDEGADWKVIPQRPGDRHHHWTCWTCDPVRGREFWASPDLYDTDPATWYWDPYQVAQRERFDETMERLRTHRAEHFVSDG